MATVKTIERRIREIEGFDVRFLHPDGRDVRGDFEGLRSYNKYARAAKAGMTVAQWKEKRFKAMYPGFRARVLDGEGQPGHGATKLGNLRSS